MNLIPFKLCRDLSSLSGDGRVVAISHRSSVYFYSGLNGQKLGKIENVHTDNITAMVRFDSLDDPALNHADFPFRFGIQRQIEIESVLPNHEL